MSAGNGQLSITDTVLEWLAARHPVKTAECVAAECGLSAGTVRKWFQRQSAPSAPALVRLIEAMPPGFLESLMSAPPKWVRAAVTACERTELEREMARIEARLAALMGDQDVADDQDGRQVGRARAGDCAGSGDQGADGSAERPSRPRGVDLA